MLEHLKLTYNQLKTLLRYMYDYKSLTEISLKMGYVEHLSLNFK